MESIVRALKTLSRCPEEKIRRKGQKMISKVFDEQKEYGLKLQDKFETLTNQDILTTSLPLRSDIPRRYRKRRGGPGCVQCDWLKCEILIAPALQEKATKDRTLVALVMYS
jgi:hypothetical protein